MDIKDGDQAVDIVEDNDHTYIDEHPVPAQLLPMILESGCRTGFNAGAGGEKGSAATGWSWMTERCWNVTSAINFIAMGEYESACDLLVDVNRKAWARIGKSPNCAHVAARIQESEKQRHVGFTADPVDYSRFVTWDKLDDRDKKMVETLTRK